MVYKLKVVSASTSLIWIISPENINLVIHREKSKDYKSEDHFLATEMFISSHDDHIYLIINNNNNNNDKLCFILKKQKIKTFTINKEVK